MNKDTAKVLSEEVRPGTSVIYRYPQNSFESERIAAHKAGLRIGDTYKVERIALDTDERSGAPLRASVKLQDHEGWFNTTLFAPTS